MKLAPGVVAEVVQSNAKENLHALVEILRPGPMGGWWVCKTLTWTRNLKHTPGNPPKRVLVPPGTIINVQHEQLAFKRLGPNDRPPT